MGLNRGGGAVAFQKVVSKVSDLPSPLDAELGQRIIVRETEEVYGLNSTTRMWEVIGTLKKVGGKKPEEIAAHVDSESNPHKVSLQDALAAGASAKVFGEVVITGKSGSIRLLAGASALRYGDGDGDGVLWLNIGTGSKTILRAVNADGNDVLVLSTDGIVSGGSATFKSFRGPAEFEDEIIATEGVTSAPGYDLVLAGDKGVLLKVGGQDAALLTDKGLVLKQRMGLTINDLALSGQVTGDLIPSKKGSLLGAPAARWAASLSELDVAGQLTLRVAANSQTAPIKVTGDIPGDTTILTAGGELGLGTDKPEARLDVRGDILVDSSLRLTKNGITNGDWATTYGVELAIAHKGKVVLRGGADGTTLLGGAKVEGDLVVTGALSLGGISGLHDQGIMFKAGGAAVYSAKSHQFFGALTTDAAKGEDLLTLKSAGDILFAVASDGAVLGTKLGRRDAPWGEASFETAVTVGETVYGNGKIAHKGEFTIDAQVLVAGPVLQLVGQRPKIEVVNTLDFVGHGGKAELALGGPNCGLSFAAKHFEMAGIDVLDVGAVNAKVLKVEGDTTLCSGAAGFSKTGLKLTGELNVGGLTFKKVTEELELSGASTRTAFELPAGVRVEAVVLQLKTDIIGARFLQVGDHVDATRFAGPFTDLKAGTLIRGMAHWGHGQAVQKAKGPIAVSGDAPASGKVLVTVHYVDPAAL